MKKSSRKTKHLLARPSFVSKQGMVEEAPSKAPPDFAELVYALVRQIPESRVCTYGQIAAWTGYPRHARLVGAVLKKCQGDVPWHRVINAKGGISPRDAGPLASERQAERLRGENVSVDEVGLERRVDLLQYQWFP